MTRQGRSTGEHGERRVGKYQARARYLRLPARTSHPFAIQFVAASPTQSSDSSVSSISSPPTCLLVHLLRCPFRPVRLLRLRGSVNLGDICDIRHPGWWSVGDSRYTRARPCGWWGNKAPAGTRSTYPQYLLNTAGQLDRGRGIYVRKLPCLQAPPRRLVLHPLIPRRPSLLVVPDIAPRITDSCQFYVSDGRSAAPSSVYDTRTQCTPLPPGPLF